MSNAMKAADDIKALATRLRSILEVADVLEKVGNLEQAVRDAENRKNAAYKESEKAVNQAEAKNEELAIIKLEIESTKAIVSDRLSQTKLQAEQIIENAKAKASNIIKEAEEMRSNSSAHVRAETLKVDALKRDIAQLEGVLTGIKNHIQEAKRKITEI